MITKKRLKLKRGDDHAFLITLNQADSLFDVSQIHRADLQAVSQVNEVLNISTENGLIEVLGDGQILLNIPHNLTEHERWLTANYDMQLTFFDGRIKTVLEGVIELSHDITQVRRERNVTYQPSLQANSDINVEIEPVQIAQIRTAIKEKEVNTLQCPVGEADFPDLLNIYNNAKS